MLQWLSDCRRHALHCIAFNMQFMVLPCSKISSLRRLDPCCKCKQWCMQPALPSQSLKKLEVKQQVILVPIDLMYAHTASKTAADAGPNQTQVCPCLQSVAWIIAASSAAGQNLEQYLASASKAFCWAMLLCCASLLQPSWHLAAAAAAWTLVRRNQESPPK